MSLLPSLMPLFHLALGLYLLPGLQWISDLYLFVFNFQRFVMDAKVMSFIKLHPWPQTQTLSRIPATWLDFLNVLGFGYLNIERLRDDPMYEWPIFCSRTSTIRIRSRTWYYCPCFYWLSSIHRMLSVNGHFEWPK